MPDDPKDVFPEGVKLREWEDMDGLRANIFDGTKKTVAEQFPLRYGGVRLELHDLDYDSQEPIPISKQKDALMSDRYLTRRLQGTYRLFDDTTGEKLDEQWGTVMRVPYLTDRGTFVHGGNEYSCVSQMRLLPGIYARRKASGEVENHFNARRGSGSSFRIRLEPETGLFKMDLGQSSLRLYSLLHDVGVSDEQLEKSWGKDLLETNRKSYDRRVFDKAYQRLVRKPDPAATLEQKQKAVLDAFQQTKLDRRVVERTLPNLFNHKIASTWAKQAAWMAAGGTELPESVYQDDPSLERPESDPGPQGVTQGASKDDLITIAMFLNAQYDAGIPLDETLSKLSADIQALIHKEMPGLNPELAQQLGQDGPSEKQALYSKGHVDRAARGSAFHHASPAPIPSLAQIRAGHYKLGHLYWKGLRISIENPKGSYRSGVSQDGRRWRTLMPMHYGYICGAEGADGDQVDIFMGPDVNSDVIYVVDQVDPSTSRFDEVKALTGFSNETLAREAYLSAYQKGWKGLGKITPVTLGEFKAWLRSGQTHRPYRTPRGYKSASAGAPRSGA